MGDLTTERLAVSEHEPGDLEALHSLLSDPVAMRYLPELRTSSLEESRDNLGTALAEQGVVDRTKYFFKILLLDGTYLGEIGITVTGTSPEGRVVNLGYFLKPEAWGKGYTTEAARAVAAHAFGRLGVDRIESGCLAENSASERALARLGMTRVAVLSRHTLHEGLWKDRVEYHLTKQEWGRLDGSFSSVR